MSNENTRTHLGGTIGWDKSTINISNIYNIGLIDTNALYKGGLVGVRSGSSNWTNYYWLENMGTSYCEGNLTNTYAKTTVAEMKALVSNGGLPSTDWATNSNINDGYPYLKVFDDTSIWLRDSNINDGDPYLKDNPPQ